jgi:hypothetical protein
MKTVAQYAKEKKIPKSTIYSWIDRKQTARNGFEVVKVGNFKLIKPLKK